MGYVGVHVVYLYSVYTYRASERKRAIIRLHCATSKSSLWYMGYVPMAVPLNAHASVVQVHLYFVYCRSLKSAREGVSQGGLGLLGKHRKRERLRSLLVILRTLKTLVHLIFSVFGL